jgi:cytochrome P450
MCNSILPDNICSSPIQIVSYAVGLYIYRIYFHPLRNFPGPKAWAYSPVPGIRSLLKGGLFREYKRIHEKYGSAVRVGPNELSFNSSQAWEDIYGHRIGHANMHKDPIHVGSVEPLAGVTTLTMADDANHARQRRALAHSFSQKALIEQEPILQMYVDKLITNLKRLELNSEELNLVNWLNFTTFDIIGDLAFGEPFGCLDDGE